MKVMDDLLLLSIDSCIAVSKFVRNALWH